MLLYVPDPGGLSMPRRPGRSAGFSSRIPPVGPDARSPRRPALPLPPVMGLVGARSGGRGFGSPLSLLLPDLAHAGALPPEDPMATVISDALKSGSPIVDISR